MSIQEVGNDWNETFSQNGEEKKIIELFVKYGVGFDQEQKFCVELGAGDGFHLSNIRYFIKRGYGFLQIDADNRGNEEVKQHKINCENIIELLETYNCPKEFVLLSIDLDGNDYWILDKILSKYKPIMIIAEFNACFPANESKAIKYDPNFTWGGNDYFGFTLEAGKKLAQKHNYKVVGQSADMNLFLLNMDYVKTDFNVNLEYQLNNYFQKSNRTDWQNV